MIRCDYIVARRETRVVRNGVKPVGLFAEEFSTLRFRTIIVEFARWACPCGGRGEFEVDRETPPLFGAPVVCPSGCGRSFEVAT